MKISALLLLMIWIATVASPATAETDGHLISYDDGSTFCVGKATLTHSVGIIETNPRDEWGVFIPLPILDGIGRNAYLAHGWITHGTCDVTKPLYDLVQLVEENARMLILMAFAILGIDPGDLPVPPVL